MYVDTNNDNMKHPRSSSEEEETSQGRPPRQQQVNEEDSKKSRFVLVRGIRYVRPYLTEMPYSVRLPNVGKTVAVVLAEAFHRRSNPSLSDTISYYSREIESGRVQLRRHKTSRDDEGLFCKFAVLLDPNRIAAKSDQFKILRHVHERCTIDRGPLQTIYMSPDEHGSYRAVLKPAGLPVVNDDVGGHGTVMGLLEGENYRPGHRLDQPVSGILLLAKGKGRASRLMQALAPACKQKEGGGGVLKAYVARVQGEMGTEPVEIKVKLHWDNRVKKACVSETEGRETFTKVTRIRFDAPRGESLVRVELGSGARHQIRAVLASCLNLPIVGDVAYGGKPYIYKDDNHYDSHVKPEEGIIGDKKQCQPKGLPPDDTELRLYADDEQGHLLDMLQQEQVDWCDKCRWQVAETTSGGTVRGTERLADYVCLLSYHYRIPSLGIDVRVPDEFMPSWAK
jgi:23S rRNA-/tRNA-specific pseudouridylate synthase